MQFNRKLAAMMISLPAVVLLATAGFPTATEIPCEIVIEHEGYKRDLKPAVHFHHQRHSEDYGISCEECHHEYVDGENVWQEDMEVKKCASCHDLNKKQGNIDKLNNSFHKNCRICHKEVGDEENAPYRKCSGCHVEE